MFKRKVKSIAEQNVAKLLKKSVSQGLFIDLYQEKGI